MHPLILVALCVFVCLASLAGGVEVSADACEQSGGVFCQPEHRCLSNSSVCNDVVDCSDASDEISCTGESLVVVVVCCVPTIIKIGHCFMQLFRK